jgi:hypothetical protein
MPLNRARIRAVQKFVTLGKTLFRSKAAFSGICICKPLIYWYFYSFARTHLSLNKDAPMPRAVQTVGRIYANSILGGLHHRYVRI